MVRHRRIAETREGPPLRRYDSTKGRLPNHESIQKLYLDSSDSAEDSWLPSTTAVLKMMLSLRFSAGLWSTIQDCDEVFNYWEPLHFLLFGKGLQTWEYSPLYAIRSYFYIGLHFLPSSILAFLLPHAKIAIFVITRCFLSAVCTAAEFYLFKAICDRFSIKIGRFFLLFSIFSSGMFISCSSFLPSTFSMVINAVAITFYLREMWFWSIFSTAASALVGWPFAALLGLPIVLDMLLFRRNIVKFLTYSLASGALISGVLVYVDSYFFGKLVLAPMNIVLYNVFSEHGPNLYGEEPFSFYIKNLLLNHNIAIPFAVAAIPLSAITYFGTSSVKSQNKMSLAFWSRYLPLLLLGTSMLSWFAVFAVQKHKEERFMYPIYPLISIFAAIGLDAFYRIFKDLSAWVNHIVWSLVLLSITISLSRSFALHRNFGAHIEIYNHFNIFVADDSALTRDFTLRNDDIRLCVGKEWYRFPSSFFLPERILDANGKTLGVRLEFLKSEFRGLLPKYYEPGKIPQVTKHIPTEMNDLNLEEPSRYFDVQSCDFIIDLDVPEEMTTDLEPNLASMKDSFRSVESVPFLISSKSHWFFRAFYIPFLTPRYTFMANYTLYVRNRF